MKTTLAARNGGAGHGKTTHKRRGRAKAVRIARPNGWDAIEALAGTVAGPADLALQHDHYARGTPKRSRTRPR